MAAVHYETFSQARDHMRDLLDAARDGRSATVQRDQTRAAVVDAERLRSILQRVNSGRVELVAEAEGWSAFLPGTPVAADGATLDEAVDELIDALREYAEDWSERLRLAANHEVHWALVQFVDLSDDDQLHAWITGG
jgi:predicted RNase H-like HicB family nuclease